MTFLRTRGTHHFTRSGWIAAAFTPVGVAASIIVAIAAGETDTSTPLVWRALGGGGLALAALAAPVAALVFSMMAARAEEPSVLPLALTAASLLALVALAEGLLVTSGWAILIGAGVSLVVIAGSAIHFGIGHHHHPPASA
jgi:hypothetical protein